MLDTEKQLYDILTFLGTVHPYLNSSGNKHCIEIRALSREEEYDFQLSKSLNIWKIDGTSTNLLKEFLEKHNGRHYCLYYSVFTFDYNMKAKTKAGKDVMKGHIASESAKFTEEIVLDFDDTSYERYLEIDKLLTDIGIDALWVHTGHGYHCHLLLNERLYDKKALLQSVYLFKSKGFNIDTACVDSARVMRLPSTINYKCMTSVKYKEERINPPITSICKESYKRYGFNELIEKISKLETVSKDDEELFLKFMEEKPEEVESNTNEIKQLVYPYLDGIDLPIPIKKILAYTPEGYRNLAFGFLIKYFKQYLKLSRDRIKNILRIWCLEACEPPIDIDRDFSRLYNINGLNYTSKLAQKYGIIDFNEITNREDIFISNDVLKDIDSFSAPEYRVYLAVKMIEHLEQVPTIKNIAQVLDISERALQPSLVSVSKGKHIYRNKGNRTLKESYSYHSTKIVSISNGYTKVSYNDLLSYIKELNGNEARVFMYMKYKCFETGKCFYSQESLGEALDLKQNTISTIMKNLESKFFIKIEKTIISKNVHYCNYILLR